MTKQHSNSTNGATNSDNTLPAQLKRKFFSFIPLFRSNNTYISQGVRFVGDLSAHQNVVVDGKMQGNIHATEHVALGSTAQFEGNIECRNATISGTFTGCLRTTDTIKVLVPASITGDLISASVEIESGVVVKGKVISGVPDRQAFLDTNTREQTLHNLVEPVEELAK